jgi:hypothetical protein
MKSAAPVIVLAAVALAAAADASAGGRGRSGGHHSHSGVRPGVHQHFVPRSTVILGAPLFFYPGPYYYPPPPPYYNPPAPVYIEPYPGTPAPQTQDWLYCPNRGAYYPYVKDCPGGWQRVLPQPQPYSPSVG